MINSIHLAKFISSILVVCIHVFAIHSYEPTPIIVFLLNMAVPFFFTTSGYLLLHKKGGELPNSAQIYKYFRKYLKLYFIWAILYIPFEISALCDMRLPIIKITYNLGWNLLVTGRFYKAWPLWYLLATLQSLGIIACLLQCGIKLRGLAFTGLFLMLVCWLLSESEITILNNIRGFYFTYFYTTRNGVFQAFGYMVGGMLVATYTKYFERLGRPTMIALCLLCGIGAFYKWPLCGVLFSGTLVWLITSVNIDNHTIWNELRILSLMYYLLHMSVIYTVIRIFPHTDSLLLFTMLILILTTIITYLLLHLQKRRGFTWLKQLWS